MNNKEWAEHIIERFGKQLALKFAESYSSCPCNTSKWECCTCKYSYKYYDLCKEGREFWDRTDKIKRGIIKRHIKRIIKNE